MGALLRWNNYVGAVVGVTENFHFASLHRQIDPLIIPHRPNEANHLLVRVQAGQISAALAAVQTELDRITPNQLFQYSFLSEDFNQLYRGEDKLGEVFRYFTGIAILIACLGLFGLAAFAAEQRTKEIGPAFPFIILKEGRGKVLGASSSGIVSLLSKDFIKLVLVANLMAWPAAWFAMSKWLEDFAYRIEIGWPREITVFQFINMLTQNPITGLHFLFSEIFISRGWWVFALAGGLALLIAVLTVNTQALKAALANPVDSLRYE